VSRQHNRVIEMVYAIEWRESAEGKVSVGPERWFPIGRQRDGLASHTIECLRAIFG